MSDNQKEPIAAGAILVITSGEYSSFGIRGVCRALRDISVEDQELAISESPTDAFAYFNRMQWIEELSYYEVWQDDYGKAELITQKHERGDKTE